jgi:YVTN family beta-propeller protein
MSYCALINDNTEAQVSENTLKSITNQTNVNVLTRAQISVGESPRFIETFGDYIYVANSLSNTVSVINTSANNEINNIPVGDYPSFISSYEDYLYVANRDSDTVSVINRHNNTVEENITTVGEDPSFIEPFGPYIYVANSGSNTVSVINRYNNTVIKNITTVGEDPSFIEPFRDYVYGANSDSGTVSVIDPNKNNTVIKNITVGENPSFISQFRDAIYVANSDSGTVSLVDPLTIEEVAGMKFDIKPFGAGQVICNGLDTPIDRFLYVTSGAKCIAKPNTGFEFSSWSQNLPLNTNVTLNTSTPSDWLGYPLTSLREAFTDDPAATLTVNRFGNFTAYFKALPPPVSTEFTASIITVIVAAFVGSLLIPAVLSWFKSKKQTSRLNSFHQQMDLIYADRKLDKNETDQSNRLNKDISDSYAAGKITNEQYANLKNEVSTAYQEIFKKRIESITERNTEDLGKINNDITDAHSNGKLSNEHYANLKNEISNTYQKIFRRRIESIHDPNTEAVNDIKNDIEDAYSDRKITELDYNLLNGKISRMLNNNS